MFTIGGCASCGLAKRCVVACICVYVLASVVGDGQYESASELFRVLSAPLRLSIIDRLTGGPAPVHELVVATGQSQPLISQHLRVLRAARLIRVETHGRERIYSLTEHPGLRTVFAVNR